jgi:hypothetical protein
MRSRHCSPIAKPDIGAALHLLWCFSKLHTSGFNKAVWRIACGNRNDRRFS